MFQAEGRTSVLKIGKKKEGKKRKGKKKRASGRKFINKNFTCSDNKKNLVIIPFGLLSAVHISNN